MTTACHHSLSLPLHQYLGKRSLFHIPPPPRDLHHSFHSIQRGSGFRQRMCRAGNGVNLLCKSARECIPSQQDHRRPRDSRIPRHRYMAACQRLVLDTKTPPDRARRQSEKRTQRSSIQAGIRSAPRGQCDLRTTALLGTACRSQRMTRGGSSFRGRLHTALHHCRRLHKRSRGRTAARQGTPSYCRKTFLEGIDTLPPAPRRQRTTRQSRTPSRSEYHSPAGRTTPPPPRKVTYPPARLCTRSQRDKARPRQRRNLLPARKVKRVFKRPAPTVATM